MKTRFGIATLFAVAVCATASFAASSGPSSTVVYVGGNDLVIKASDGKLLNYMVPAGYAFTDGGKPATLDQLKPGDKLTAPVATGAEPQVVVKVAVLKSKVYAVSAPDGLTISSPDGAMSVIVPAGTKFMVDGKSVGLSGLAPGAMIDATVVTPAAEGDDVASAPSTPPLAGALLVAKVLDMPSTGTRLPTYGLVGLTMLLAGLAMLRLRRPASAR